VSGRILRHCRVAALGCAWSLLSGHASADSSAVVAGAAAGAAAGLAAASTQPLLAPTEIIGRALPEWVDVRTGSASRLNSGCGFTIEASLSGTPQQNYLNLTLQREEETEATFHSGVVSAHFGSGLVRKLNAQGSGSGVVIPGGSWLHLPLAFPDKAEFEHESRLRIEVLIEARELGTCIASVEFVRRTDIAVPERSYTSYPPLAVAFGINTHFAASGDLRTIASNVNPGFELGFYGFPWVRHGIGLEFGFDAYGSKGLPAVLPDRAANGLGGIYFMATYSYRVLLSKRFTPQLDVGAGIYGLYVQTDDKDAEYPSASAFSLREKLKLNILLGSLYDGTRFELAPALIHTYIPAGDFGNASVSGNLFSGALYLIVD